MQIMNVVFGQEYEKNGEIKKTWIKVGKLLIKDDGKMSIKLDTMPVGNFDGWLAVFESNEGAPDQPSSGYDKFRQQGQAMQEKIAEVPDGEIDLSNIPF